MRDMGQTNKNIPSLHRFVETAAIDAVLMLLCSNSELTGQSWLATAASNAVDPDNGTACGEVRQDLLRTYP